MSWRPRAEAERLRNTYLWNSVVMPTVFAVGCPLFGCELWQTVTMVVGSAIIYLTIAAYFAWSLRGLPDYPAWKKQGLQIRPKGGGEPPALEPVDPGERWTDGRSPRREPLSGGPVPFGTPPTPR